MPKLTSQTLSLALQLNVRDILIWPNPPGCKTGPLVLGAQHGIGIEVGTKNCFREMSKKLEKIVSDVIPKLIDKSLPIPSEKSTRGRRFYHVYDDISPKDIGTTNPKDFSLVVGENETFLALLFGQHKGFLGYKMRKMDGIQVLNHLKMGSLC